MKLYKARKNDFSRGLYTLNIVRPSVTVAQNIEVTSMVEAIVDAYVDKHENQGEDKECRLLVEKHPNLPEGYSCILIPTIMDAAKSTTLLIHLFNPHTDYVIDR